ncbi:hemolysin family protein [Pseudaquidulcibacter saccharophilus]|uniref:hemolysin family protein n=1 Tax=Pseudaquidulcibacter saccharophilus TaxID=2831900 RepID=UPI001EFF36D1|nr:hemolysin family protein [Pseudaquidulcibacter saccharophilus]
MPSSDDGSSEKKSLFGRLRSVMARKTIDSESQEIIETLEQANKDTYSQNKREMLFKVASFDRLNVGDVMVPRADIEAVEAETTLGELAQIFAENQHSRMPVYRENLDNPIGFVHVKDILSLLTPNSDGVVEAGFDDKPISRIKRDLVYAPVSMRLPNLLLLMRAQRCHMALVIDEYGGTDGLVTIEDLVEEIIGEIDDEYDDEITNALIERGPDKWEVDARLPIKEFEEETGIIFNTEDAELEVDTMGGLAFAVLGRVPLRGEIISDLDGFEMEIIDADPRRINRLIIRKTDNKKDEKGAD